MRRASKLAALMSGLHFIGFTSPAAALEPAERAGPPTPLVQRAGPPTPPAQRDVQPVPYQPSQPVPVAPPSDVPPTTAMHPPADGGGDVVFLKSGGLLRGSIVELLPGDHATVLLPTGQTAMVQWAAIQRIERSAASPGQASSTPPPDQAGQPQSHADSVFVHIQSTHGVTLERRNDAVSKDACTAPCDMWLPLNDSYRITGHGLNSSPWFALDGPPGGRVTLTVTAATKLGFYAGGIIATAGAVLGVLGAMTISGSEKAQQTGQESAQQAHAGEAVGTGMAVVGAGVIVVGLYVLFSNLRSDQSQEASPPGGAPPDAARKASTGVRQAVWKEPSQLEKAMPKTQGLELFTVRF